MKPTRAIFLHILDGGKTQKQWKDIEAHIAAQALKLKDPASVC